MARPFRCQYEGAICHVTARGNERRPIFRDDTDRQRFVGSLQALGKLHHVCVHAYALMPNHYHLVLCTPRGNLSVFMQQFNTSYTVYYNRRHRRFGHADGATVGKRLSALALPGKHVQVIASHCQAVRSRIAKCKACPPILPEKESNHEQ